MTCVDCCRVAPRPRAHVAVALASATRLTRTWPRLAIAAALGISVAIVGCQSSGQTGLLAGAGIGALAGQAIGGNTAGTLIGAGVGAGVGYVIGNERDRSQARDMSARQQREIDELRAQQRTAPPASAPAPPPPPPPRSGSVTAFQHSDTGPLANTRWSVTSLSPRDVTRPFLSMIVDFRPGGRVVTTTTREDGSVDVFNERYRVVGDTLIINQENYLINTRFGISGDQLILSADRFSAVLQRLPS